MQPERDATGRCALWTWKGTEACQCEFEGGTNAHACSQIKAKFAIPSIHRIDDDARLPIARNLNFKSNQRSSEHGTGRTNANKNMFGKTKGRNIQFPRSLPDPTSLSTLGRNERRCRLGDGAVDADVLWRPAGPMMIVTSISAAATRRRQRRQRCSKNAEVKRGGRE